MTREPDPTMAAADRQILIIGAGIFLILALLAFIPDVSPSGAHGLVSERAHARIESITPATDQSPPLAVIVFVDGSRAGQRTEAQVEFLLQRLVDINRRGVTLLVVEHNMDLVMNVAERVFVMDHGVPLYEGTPREVQANPAVIEAYLGGAFAA